MGGSLVAVAVSSFESLFPSGQLASAGLGGGRAPCSVSSVAPVVAAACLAVVARHWCAAGSSAPSPLAGVGSRPFRASQRSREFRHAGVRGTSTVGELVSRALRPKSARAARWKSQFGLRASALNALRSAPRGRSSLPTLWAARGRRRSCPAGANAPMPGTGTPSRVIGRRGRRAFRYSARGRRSLTFGRRGGRLAPSPFSRFYARCRRGRTRAMRSHRVRGLLSKVRSQ